VTVIVILAAALLILAIINTLYGVRLELIESRKEMDEIRARRRNQS
jgi:hypothetical protein